MTIETRVDAYNEEDLPKSEAGLRTVPIGADVLHHLRKWKMRSKWSKPDDLVFPNGSKATSKPRKYSPKVHGRRL